MIARTAKPSPSLAQWIAMRSLLLARHGQTAWNALGKLQGHTDIALDDTGREQARALARSLAAVGIRTVWTSDLGRARETGEIIAAQLGLAVPRTEPELRERKFGVFEGLTRDDCATQHPEHWAAWLAQTGSPPGGEPREEAVARMARALERIAAREEGPALVVSHGGVMRLWLMHLLGTTVPLIANGATFLVEHANGAFALRHRE
jgi:broad specificity phosphatase PhoE